MEKHVNNKVGKYMVDVYEEQNWYFTFGVGTMLKDNYAKFFGTYNEARLKMFNFFGDSWCAQYCEQEFLGEDMPKTYNLTEIEDIKTTSFKYRVHNELEKRFNKIVNGKVAEEFAERWCFQVMKELEKLGSDGRVVDWEFDVALGKVLSRLTLARQ